MTTWSGPSYTQNPFGWETLRRSGAFHLMILNLAAFLIVSIFLLAGKDNIIQTLGLSVIGLAEWKLWQPLSFSLTHQNPIWLALSLLMLWLFAPSLEQHIGRIHLYGVYLAGILCGGSLFLLATLVGERPALVAIGSTCATSAVFMAFVALYPNVQFLFGIRAKYWAMVAAAISLWFLIVGGSLHQLLGLGGMIAGLAYVKWLSAETAASFLNRNLGALLTKVSAGASRKSAAQIAPAEETAPVHFITKEVDPILDKISKHGMQSLTPEEKHILEKASRKLGRGKS